MRAILLIGLAVGLVALSAPTALAHTGSVVCVDDPVCYTLCMEQRAVEIVKGQQAHTCEYRQS